MKNIIIHKAACYNGKFDGIQISFEEIKQLLRSGKILRHLFLYNEATLLTYNIETVTKPFATAVLLRLFSLKKCLLRDEFGHMEVIQSSTLYKKFRSLLHDFHNKNLVLDRVSDEVDQIRIRALTKKPFQKITLSSRSVYLRTDLWFGVSSGGSVGHIAGVLNNLDSYTGKPLFLTSDKIPTVKQNIETHTIYPDRAYWDFKELPSVWFNYLFASRASEVMKGEDLAFVYQRYSVNNFSGVKLSMAYNVPFILEYNGSEIWINRNWGKPLKYEKLSERIELLNLEAADVVVVVSRPMKDELVARGVEPDKILVNPNGVDPDRYSPEIDGTKIRGKYSLTDKVVIGFIGTFGKWHGAEILAEAFGRLLQTFPEYRERVRLLMIGDGLTIPQVREVLDKHGAGDHCILTGLIPQQEGPEHLAACDILASPHVPNPDGTPFFGSPTKLFEYMAMAKGIVASELDQIGEILDHGRTAWMVKPGDVEGLMMGLKLLVDDAKLCHNLGEAARQEVIAKYTWKEHTHRIVSKLKERCGS